MQEVYIDNYPQSVTRAALEVIVMIFATNNFSSFSTCIQDNFQCEFNAGSLSLAVVMHSSIVYIMCMHNYLTTTLH